MNIKKTIFTVAIIGGLTVFGVSMYKYFKKQLDLLKDFKYTIIGISFTEMTLQVIKGILSVRFESSADVEIVVEEFYVDFYFNEKKIGYLTDDSQFVLPAKGYTDIDFQFTLDPQFVLTNFVDIVSYATKQKDASIMVDGFVKLKSGFIETTLPVTYSTTISEIMK